MTKQVTLDYFGASKHFYHVYKTESSAVSEQLHYHDYYQISYVLRGEIMHRQQSEEVKLIRGDAFIIPPEFVHSVVFSHPNAIIYSLSFKEDIFYSGFTSSAAYKFMKSISLSAIDEEVTDIRLRVRLDELQHTNIKALFDCLEREFLVDMPRQLTAAGSLIAAIILVLSQAYYSNHPEDTSSPSPHSHSLAMEQCIKYIDQNFMYPIPVPYLLQRFAMSRSTFGSLFPEMAGVPFKQYLAKKRVEQAIKLLEVSTLTLEEIAEMVGYNDFSTFYRNFTKITGISATRYRKGLQRSANT